MFELPLFPLNTVLFPGMPLALHIFEERYKEMIGICLEKRLPFGVILIRNGQEARGSLAEPYEVGCTARIINSESLPDGRMNIEVVGQNRFRLLSLKHDRPYLVGDVELYPLGEDNAPSLMQSGLRLRPWVQRYMQLLTNACDVNLEPKQVPQDPLVLAYLAAVLLQVPPDQKQYLLAAERAIDLLTDMHAIYRREVALLQAMFQGGSPTIESSFSAN